MSFRRLLAAGRSVMGIKKEPSPYRMNQEHLLPKFAPLPKGTAAFDALSVAAGVETQELRPSHSVRPRAGGRAAKPKGARPSERPELSSRRTMLPRWVKRLVGLESAKNSPHPGGATAGHAVQTELALAGLKAVRNDLVDSDFAVETARTRASLAGATIKPRASRPAIGMVWNRLSAPLLRQAAQEFSSVQKERGKLFTQTSPRDGSPRRT